MLTSSSLHTVEQEYRAVGASEEAVAQLYWAALGGAAVRAGPQQLDSQLLLDLWAQLPARAAQQQPMPDDTAGRLIAAMDHQYFQEAIAPPSSTSSADDLCQQLLAAPLPVAAAGPMLQAACRELGGSSAGQPEDPSGMSPFIVSYKFSTARFQVLELLLQHAEQHGLLQQLQPCLLQNLLQQVSLSYSTVPAAAVCSLLAALLQHSSPLEKGWETATAALLLPWVQRQQPDHGEQLLQCLQSLQDTPAAADRQQGLLCELLLQAEQAAEGTAHRELTWQLYELLAAGLNSHAASKQVVTKLAAVSSALIQSSSGAQSDAAGRVLQVWQQLCAAAGSVAAAAGKLDSTALQAVLAAVVSAKQHEQALQIAQAEGSLLLPLTQLWQQQQQRQPLVDAALLAQAVQACLGNSTEEAATAAELLLPLLLLHGESAVELLQQGSTTLQLIQLLCKYDKLAGVLQLLNVMLDSLSGGNLPPGDAVQAVQAAAVAVSNSGTQSQQERLVQLLARGEDTLQLARAAVSSMLARGAAPAPAVALLLHSLQQQDSSQHGLLTQLQPVAGQLCKLVCASSNSSSSSSSSSTRSKVPADPLLCLPSPFTLAAECADSTSPLLSANTTAQLLNAVAAAHPELQPTPAAAALGVLDPSASHTPAAQTPARPVAGPDAALDLSSATKVLAKLCWQQLQQFDGDTTKVHAWVQGLTAEAAAAVLFAVWHWAQPPQAEAAVATQAGSAAAAAVPESLTAVCLELYFRSKLSGDGLVFDMGLMAAAEAAETSGDWAKGSDIIAAAEKVHDSSTGGGASRGSKAGRSNPSTGRLPALPAAYPALLSVLVHTNRVDTAKQLLLAEYEEQLGQQQQQAAAGAAARRKGGKAAAASGSSRAGAAGASTGLPAALLAPAAVNSFLSAAVSVVRDSRARLDDDCAEGAAVAAVEVARALFKQPLLLVSMASAGAAVQAAMAAPLKGPQPDAFTWACLVELYGYVEQLGLGQREVRLSQIVRAACRQQLLGVQGQDGLQRVLAGAAAALNTAQQHTTAVHLLSGLLAAGVQAVSDPGLAQQLCTAADDDEAFEVLASYLADEEDIIEALPALGSAPQAGVAVCAVQLAPLEAAQAWAQLQQHFPH